MRFMDNKKKKHPGGRPSDYKPEYSRMAKLCIEDSGFSMFKLAKLFNCARSTIYYWIEHEKEFSDAVENGRTVWDGKKIHKSLVKRAVGFSYNETTKEPVGEGGELKITRVVRKYFPPEVSAIKHWQVNRAPEKWSDKVDVNQTTTFEFSEEDKTVAKEIAQILARRELERIKK
jgi:hypothetical protein